MRITIDEINEISRKFRDLLPKCPRCNGPMITDPNYKDPYCGSWEYMEGGCLPAPMPVSQEGLET
jgi:hypothetical protein